MEERWKWKTAHLFISTSMIKSGSEVILGIDCEIPTPIGKWSMFLIGSLVLCFLLSPVRFGSIRMNEWMMDGRTDDR